VSHFLVIAEELVFMISMQMAYAAPCPVPLFPADCGRMAENTLQGHCLARCHSRKQAVRAMWRAAAPPRDL